MSNIVQDGVSAFGRLLRDESAATAIEYSLIASLVSISAVAGFIDMGDALTHLWDTVGEAIESGLR